jgi:hypothetical protein
VTILIALLFKLAMVISAIGMEEARGAWQAVSIAAFFVAMIGLVIYASKVFPK